jgi:L-2-amino-thiazoline-4-carboxylic acid hydrolase
MVPVMPESRDWGRSGPEAARALVRAFLEAVASRVGADAGGPSFLAEADALCARLEAAHRGWVIDEAAAANLHMLAAVLAAYRVLSARLPAAECIPLLRDSFSGQFRAVVREGTARWLDGVTDPFRAIVELSRSKEEHSFGAGFGFEHERDDDRAYILNISRCFYHDFFVANGAPELTPVFCDFDLGWIEAIDPGRHHLRFERPTTIGYGGARCPFRFYRTQPREGT